MSPGAKQVLRIRRWWFVVVSSHSAQLSAAESENCVEMPNEQKSTRQSLPAVMAVLTPTSFICNNGHPVSDVLHKSQRMPGLFTCQRWREVWNSGICPGQLFTFPPRVSEVLANLSFLTFFLFFLFPSSFTFMHSQRVKEEEFSSLSALFFMGEFLGIQLNSAEKNLRIPHSCPNKMMLLQCVLKWNKQCFICRLATTETMTSQAMSTGNTD